MATLKPHAGVPVAAEVDYAAEAGQGGDEPMEEAGMTDEVIRKVSLHPPLFTTSIHFLYQNFLTFFMESASVGHKL